MVHHDHMRTEGRSGATGSKLDQLDQRDHQLDQRDHQLDQLDHQLDQRDSKYGYFPSITLLMIR